ncbi:MAG: hypothetical protein H0W86_00095 [Armatimonadetes bacterium]|nr:hypothetical protein [Armatimonadota bacterium]
MLPKFQRGWAPFPNVLIDLVMPTLTDTEWRLLTVIVRQTLGWQDASKRRKAVDWLSHKILRKKTGRRSSALSAAIASLDTKQLIVVYDRRGHVLSTPAMRRRAHDSMLIGLNPAIHSFSTVWPALSTKKILSIENNKRTNNKKKTTAG